MQGRRSSMGSLPDTISFDLNPNTADINIDQPMYWNNNIQEYSQTTLNGFTTSNINNGSTFINPAPQVQNLSGWNLGESSSGVARNYAIGNEHKSELVPINAAMNLNQSNSPMPYSPLFMQSARNITYPQGLNMGIEVQENNGHNSSAASIGTYRGEEIYSSEGRHLPRKRKVIEGHIGQSSSSGSPSYFNPREANEWNNIPGWYNNHFGSTTSSENPLSNSQIPVPPLNLNPNIESSRRNQRVRMSSSPQQSSSPTLLPNGSISGDTNILSYPQPSRLLPFSNSSGTRTPQLRRFTRGSGSRTGYPMGFGERIVRPSEEPESNISQRTILENPVFVPNGNISIAGNVSRNANPIPNPVPNPIPNPIPNTTPNTIPNPSGVSQRTHPRYSRRLSDYVRRSLLSSPLPESGVQNANLPLQGESSSQAVPLTGTSGNNGDRLLRLRAALLMERQLDSSSGGANSLRNATGGTEGRTRLVSEIRNVLDLMRRGEGLRMEDMVILDQSGFFGMADIHDRHRDMRLDVDNMSYEELLALEERMGNVNTGLSEETILNHLKRRKFFPIAMCAQSELEPCCICREDYNIGEDIGTVECGHEFHSGCIKQWLMIKNSCPICKTTALNK